MEVRPKNYYDRNNTEKEQDFVVPLMATALMYSSLTVDRLSERSLERAALTDTSEGTGSIVNRNFKPDSAANDDADKQRK